jgi:hypothetical protein
VTLTEFLLARIAEDEATARAALDYSEGRWHWELHRGRPYRSALVNERGTVVLPPKNSDVYPSAPIAGHIARHDPARVLAECEAKRRIVERLGLLVTEHFSVSAGERHRQEAQHPHLCDWRHMRETRMLELERTLGDLAAVYADHPDYREEWRP